MEGFYSTTEPTPLYQAHPLAQYLGIGELLIKDETHRLGLNAFKILGVRYAVEKMRREGLLPPDAVLACATDGNHGRAVARTASRAGLRSQIYLPRQAAEQRIRAIREEGAEVTIVGGTYDDAVRRVAADAAVNGWVVLSDMSWPGYEDVPRWVMLGYTQMLFEAAKQWVEPPDIVLVQAGVGGLACAVGSWFAHRYGKWRPYLISAEPVTAACVLEAARAGRPVALAGDQQTAMDCLSAGMVSPLAWPAISSTYDAFVAIEDARAMEAAGLLGAHDPLIHAGYSGACGLGALIEILNDESMEPVRAAAGLDGESRVMVIVTEGGGAAVSPAAHSAVP